MVLVCVCMCVCVCLCHCVYICELARRRDVTFEKLCWHAREQGKRSRSCGLVLLLLLLLLLAE